MEVEKSRDSATKKGTVATTHLEQRPSMSADAAMYDDGRSYWSKVPATVDGMLGGFSQVNSADISTSRRFLKQFIHGEGANTGCERALDCGCGIGRVTKHLLSELFQQVDMLEQNATFLDEARKVYLGDKAARVDRYICSGLQDFEPEHGRYDVIWVQWVLSHLPDDGVQRFLDRSRCGVRDGGLLVLKENVVSGRGGEDEERDVHDITITRSKRAIRKMVARAGFTVVKELRQTRFPAGLYEVRMFACKPTTSADSVDAATAVGTPNTS